MMPEEFQKTKLTDNREEHSNGRPNGGQFGPQQGPSANSQKPREPRQETKRTSLQKLMEWSMRNCRERGANVFPEIFRSNTLFGLKNQNINFQLNASLERKPVQLLNQEKGDVREFSTLEKSCVLSLSQQGVTIMLAISKIHKVSGRQFYKSPCWKGEKL